MMGLLALPVFTACSEDDENIDPENSCEIAIVATTNAQTELESATDENYTSACTTYKAALEAQIEACGDADGSLQAIIDGLGDCIQEVDDDKLSVNAGTLPVDFDIVEVKVIGGLIKVSGTSTFSDDTIYFEVAKGAEGETAIQNFEIVLLDKAFYPYNEGSQFDFTSEITTNTTGVLIGSFYNVVTNEDGADVNLTNGTIDLEY